MSYVIRIGSSADTSGIDKATGALQKADTAADEFIASIKAGVGIDIGGRLVGSLTAIPGILSDAISRGVEFNKSMNDSQIGIANVLAKFQGLNKEAAKAEASKAMAKILEIEPKTAAGLQDLVQGFMATVASAQSAGVSVEQNIDLVGRFANALANANIDASQLSQELRAIFTGNITPDAQLAKVLDITAEDIAKGKEAGNLYDVLVQKIGTIGEAGDTAGVRLSSLQSAIDKTLGKITEPIFDAWLESLSQFTEAANENPAALRNLAVELAELVKVGTSLTVWLTSQPGLLAGVAKGVGFLTAAWLAFKIGSIVVGLTSKTRALLASTAAITAETAAVRASTVANEANAVSVGKVAAARGAMSRVGAVAATGVGALVTGVGIGYEIQNSVFNQATSRAFGGASTEQDLQRTNALLKERMEVTKGYIDEAKNLTSEEERQKLIEKMTADIRAMGQEMADTAWNETGRRTTLEAEIAGQQRLLQTVQKMSLEKNQQAAKERQMQVAQKEEEERRKKQLEENKQILADDAAKRTQGDRAKFAGGQLKEFSGALDAGNLEYAKSILDSAESFQKDQLAGVKIDPETMDEKALKSALSLRDEFEGYLAEIAAAREDLARAERESVEKGKEAQITALQDQLALIAAQGEQRLADIEAASLTEAQRLESRKRVEDEIARRRLEVENQIGQLQGESALAREARQIAANAAQTTRDTTLKDGLARISPEAGFTAPGQLQAGTNRRRGIGQSDASFDSVPIGQSLLDQYQLNQARPVGAIGGKSILPADPKSSLAGGKESDPGAAGAETVKDAAEKVEEAVSKVEDGTKEGLQGVGSAITKLGNVTRSELKRLEAKIDAVANQIT